MRISQAMLDALNAQIKMEFQACHYYMASAAEMEERSLVALAALMWEQADEERVHAMKIVRHVIAMGAKPAFEGIDAPKVQDGSVEAQLQSALDNEQAVTDAIHKIVALAEKENDFPTRGFIQWFVDEQMEELDKFETLVAWAKLAGDNLLLLEQRVQGFNFIQVVAWRELQIAF